MSGAKDKNVIERHPVVSTIIGTVLLAAIGGLFTLTYNTGYNGGAKDYEYPSAEGRLWLSRSPP
jgi:hypothetical protein